MDVLPVNRGHKRPVEIVNQDGAQFVRFFFDLLNAARASSASAAALLLLIIRKPLRKLAIAVYSFSQVKPRVPQRWQALVLGSLRAWGSWMGRHGLWRRRGYGDLSYAMLVSAPKASRGVRRGEISLVQHRLG